MVLASEGAAAIQSALNSASNGDVVTVTGSGTFSWTESIEVPDNVALNVSDNVSVEVPSNHNLTAYSPNGATVYSLITNANRSSASNVTISGGEYDLSAMPETAEYAGIWLHNASDSEIDDVVCRGAGQAVFGSGTNRGFNLALTRCTRSIIRDSAGYDGGYDDIAVRGGCVDCSVIRSGGSGASSGTIQTARWGKWGLTGYPQGTTFDSCWGRRIYDHDGIDTEWINCTSNYRLQTIGTDNALIRDSTDFEGYVLLYTYDSGSPYSEVRNMDFQMNSVEDYAIRAGPNGPSHGTIVLDGITGARPELFRLGSYSGGGNVETIIIRNCDFTGNGTRPIVTRESGAASPDIIVENSTFTNFSEGITGTYDSVRVNNVTFNDIDGEPINVTSGDIQTSGISIDQKTPTGDLEVYAENDRTGDRISGATVTVEWLGEPLASDPTGPWSDTTNSTGQASFSGVPIGYYNVTVEHSEYEIGTYGSRYWRDVGEESNEALHLTESNSPRRPIIHLDTKEDFDVSRRYNVYRGDTTLYRWSTNEDWSVAEMTNTVQNNQGGIRSGWNMDENPWSTYGVSFWPMDGIDNEIIDYIGTSETSLDSSIVTMVDGPNNSGAIHIDTGDYFEITAGNEHGFGGSFTIIAMIKPSKIHRGTILRTGGTGSATAGTIFLETHEDGGMSFGYYDSDGTAQWYAPFLPDELNIGEWNFVVGTFDQVNQNIRVHVNDQWERSTSVSGNRPAQSSGHTIRFGQHPDLSERDYEGDMAWVGILNDDITISECRDLRLALYGGEITVKGKE